MKKKGVFYTMGFVLLSMLLLAIAILFVQNAEIKHGAKDLFHMDNVNNKFHASSLAMKRIFDKYSDVGYSVTNGSLSITDTLPNQNLEIFSSKLSDYSRFLDFMSRGKINLCKTSEKLVLKDINFTYDQKNITIEGNIGKSYSIWFTIQSPANLTTLNWNTEEGDYLLMIDAYDEANNHLSGQRYLDPSKDNYAVINTFAGDIWINITKNRFVVTNNEETIEISTKLFYNLSYGPNLYFSEDCLKITSENVKITYGARLK